VKVKNETDELLTFVKYN